MVYQTESTPQSSLELLFGITVEGDMGSHAVEVAGASMHTPRPSVQLLEEESPEKEMIDGTLKRLRKAAAPAHEEALKMLASFAAEEDRSGDPPPLPDQRMKRAPAMLQALRNNVVNEVRYVLEKNPGAANEPFPDHEFEPPLVCAVRLQCKAAIVRLLLEHGASPDTTDIYGCSALQLEQKIERIEANAWSPPMSETAFHAPLLGMAMASAFPQIRFQSAQSNPKAAFHSDVMNLFEDRVGVEID